MIIRCEIYFVFFFFFVVCANHENIFTTKISRFTVPTTCTVNTFAVFDSSVYEKGLQGHTTIKYKMCAVYQILLTQICVSAWQGQRGVGGGNQLVCLYTNNQTKITTSYRCPLFHRIQEVFSRGH